VGFTYLTFAAARAALASRLQDPSLVYWNQPGQLDACIVEALRFFQTLTGSYKQKITFTALQDTNYYDLPNLSGSGVSGIAAIAYTATDVEVANNVLAALLEPSLGAALPWTGTGQFTFSQLHTAIQNRLNRFLGDTGCRVVQQGIAAPTPPDDMTALPDTVLDVRRVGWTPVPQATPPANPTWALGRMDEWAEQAYIPGAAQNPTQPMAYSTFGVPPVQGRLIPPPLSGGQLDCLLVVAGPTVNCDPANPVALQIPDDLSPALKWGALADLLGSDGPSRDYARAAYAEQRYQEFVQAARIYPSVLTADMANVTIGLGSVFDMDCYQPDWQQTTGVPSFVGMCGRNLACVGQTPDGNGPYSVGLWMAANAPTAATVSAAGFVQVSRDQIDPILDYAQHIASFQMGGVEFDGTTRLYQNLITCAKAQNGRLEAIGFYKDQMYQFAQKSEMETERMVV
jgi:hypothetical protein